MSGSVDQTEASALLAATIGRDVTGWSMTRAESGWLIVSDGDPFAASRYFITDERECYQVPSHVPGSEALEDHLRDPRFRHAMRVAPPSA